MASIIYDCWDVKYNRPIVGGKVTNPTTGEVEEAGPLFKAGPPSIRTIWCNVESPSPLGWATFGTALNCPIDKALYQVAQHIQQGLYSIVSLNASEFCLTIICNSTMPLEEFRQVIHTMKFTLNEDRRDYPGSQDNKGIFLILLYPLILKYMILGLIIS